MKIIMLDVDGVLLSGRAAVLPGNVALTAKARPERHSSRERALASVFDPCAVALVNRLAERTSAKLVVHSNWRRAMDAAEVVAKLLEQGIEERHLHADRCCPVAYMSAEKVTDICAWLGAHRVSPWPVWPADVPSWPEDGEPFQETVLLTPEQQARVVAYHRDREDYGVDVLVIDDERVGYRMPQVLTDRFEGFAVADYRVACGYLGGEDRAYGVYPLAEDDRARVLEVFEGDRLAAAEWLYAAQWRNGMTRAERLHVDSRLRESELAAASGYIARARDHVAVSRAFVWRELGAVADERARERANAEERRRRTDAEGDDF